MSKPKVKKIKAYIDKAVFRQWPNVVIGLEVRLSKEKLYGSIPVLISPLPTKKKGKK